MSVVIDYRPGQRHDSAVARALAWCSGHGRGLAAGAAVLLWLAFAFGVRPRQNRQVVETLQNPVAFTGWTADGVLLADGREAKLPGVCNFQEPPPATLPSGEHWPHEDSNRVKSWTARP